MPPQTTVTCQENDKFENNLRCMDAPEKPTVCEKRKYDIVWRNVVLFTLLHIGAVYGFYLGIVSAMWSTDLFAYFLYVCAGLGITAGSHRLWTHKSYKATLPLQILLVLFHTLAFQYAVIDWVREHRMHHKYSETDADPHNAKRGFFFSHIGWMMVRKHPEVIAKGRTLDLSDVKSDPVLRFQKKFFKPLALLISFVIPLLVPLLWGESLWNSFFTCVVWRQTYVFNATWFVNSAAHMWGNKPYDKHINPVENKAVSWIAVGEGFHNYHHTFPWDYKAAELGAYGLNWTTFFIDIMASIGWAYELKTVPKDVIQNRIERTGDSNYVKRKW